MDAELDTAIQKVSQELEPLREQLARWEEELRTQTLEEVTARREARLSRVALRTETQRKGELERALARARVESAARRPASTTE